MGEESYKDRLINLYLQGIVVFVGEVIRYLIQAIPGLSVAVYGWLNRVPNTFLGGFVVAGIVVANLSWISQCVVRRRKETKDKDFKVRDLSLLLNIGEGGKKVTYRRAIKLICIRSHGVKSYRFRLHWSGEDDIKTKLKAIPPTSSGHTQYELCHQQKYDPWECFQVSFKQPLCWRQPQEIMVLATLDEPNIKYKKMLTYYTVGEPFIRSFLYSRLHLTVQFAQDGSDPCNIQALEYPYFEYLFTERPPKSHKAVFDSVERKIKWDIHPKFLHYYVLEWE